MNCLDDKKEPLNSHTHTQVIPTLGGNVVSLHVNQRARLAVN